MSEAKLYGGLEKFFEGIDGPLRLDEFAMVEAALHLFSMDDPEGDPANAFLLFQNYHLIGAGESIGEFGHLLQKATEVLWPFGGEGKWRSMLEGYMDPAYDRIRMFKVSGNTLERIEPGFHSSGRRIADWEKLVFDRVPDNPEISLAGGGFFKYWRNEEAETGTVDLRFIPEGKVADPPPRNKGVRPAIPFSVDELASALDELDSRNRELSEADGRKRRTNHAQTFRSCLPKTAKGETIESIDINRFKHLAGAVGSGKSTLIKAMAISCAKRGIRACVIVPGIPESMRLCAELCDFGIDAIPLMGKGDKQKHADKLMGDETFCPDRFVSSHLATFCAIRGLDRNNCDFHEIKEPCFALSKKGEKKGSKKFACPFLHECPGQRMYMAAASAPIVVTNPWSFAQTRIGAGRHLFLRHVLDEFDLVIVDEADRIQCVFDEEFVPTLNLHKNCIIPASEQSDEYNRKPLPRQSRLSDSEHQYRHCLYDIEKTFSSLHRILMNSRWPIVNSGSEIWVSGLLRMLLPDDRDVAERGEWRTPHIPKKMFDEIDAANLDRNSDYRSRLHDLINEVENPDRKKYERMYRDWISSYDLSGFPKKSNLAEDDYEERLHDCLKVIFIMILFSIRLYNLGSACMSNPGSYSLDSDLSNFLFRKFDEQMSLMPKSLCGNIFGLRARKNEKGEVEDYGIVRLFAYGRILLSGLPWLRTDKSGMPAGPHVLAMSGTSWLPGSLQLDVLPIPDYVIETPEEHSRHLRKTEVFLPFDGAARVSGASGIKRKWESESPKEKAMRKLLGDYVGIILENCDEGRKCLILVNSYAQGRFAKKCLSAKFGMDGNPGIVIVREPGDKEFLPREGKLKDDELASGNIEAFARMEEKILIAPSSIAGRSLNIVLPNGHSAISSVFYLIRPFECPGALDAICGKMNGYVRAKIPDVDGPIWKRNRKIRDAGNYAWRWLNSMDNRCFTQRDSDSRRDTIAATMGGIIQSSGRMARVGDLSAPAPRIYFMDGAFGNGSENEETKEMDFIAQMWAWMEGLVKGETGFLYGTLLGWLHSGFARALGKDND